MFKGCPILIAGQKFILDLYYFYLSDFGLILGIKYLSKYHAQINHLKQKVTLRGHNRDKVVDKGANSKLGVRTVRLISMLKVQKLTKQGCKGYLYDVVDSIAIEPPIESILVICKFLNVFANESLTFPHLGEWISILT